MTSDPLSPEAVSAADPSGMLDDVLAQPAQLADAVWRAESAAFPRVDASSGLVVAGMGGSGVGCDLAAAILDGRATRPIHSARGYELPAWVGPDTFVLCQSYSGDTEETLACFEAAGEAGAPRAVVTTGGELGDLARAAGVPVMGVPSGFQPRAAVIYMTVAVLEAAAACGAAPAVRGEIEGAADVLGRTARDPLAKRLATALKDTIPVIVGAGRTSAAALRWKTQINENASRPAFWNELPEADHNEICGYGDPLCVTFLDDPTLDPRLRRRIDLTAQLIEVPAEVVEARGETPFERVMSLVLMGDLVSVYLAVLAGEDPTPVPSIERLKEALG